MCNEKAERLRRSGAVRVLQLLPAISLLFQDLEQTFAGSADAT
jgi:hypothetical protein